MKKYFRLSFLAVTLIIASCAHGAPSDDVAKQTLQSLLESEGKWKLISFKIVGSKAIERNGNDFYEKYYEAKVRALNGDAYGLSSDEVVSKEGALYFRYNKLKEKWELDDLMKFGFFEIER